MIPVVRVRPTTATNRACRWRRLGRKLIQEQPHGYRLARATFHRDSARSCNGAHLGNRTPWMRRVDVSSWEMAVSWMVDSALQHSALRIVEDAGRQAAPVRLDDGLRVRRGDAPTGSIRP